MRGKPLRVLRERSADPGRPLDGPQPKKTRSSRQGQQPPANPTGRNRRLVADDEEAEAAGSAGGAASSFIQWGKRNARQNSAWAGRLKQDAHAYVASLPAQTAQQSELRQLILSHKQAQLDAALPLPCHDAAPGSCCQFVKTGQQEATYFGPIGIVGKLNQPLFSCTVHSRASLTAHPLQYSCVPTAPVINTKLLDVELVAAYRIFQLKDGVGGHGKQQAGVQQGGAGVGVCARWWLSSVRCGWCRVGPAVIAIHILQPAAG